MNAEGVGHVFSPEVIQATLTLLPIWLGAFWIVRGASALWRLRVEHEAYAEIRTVAEAWGTTPRPCWNGWRAEDGARRLTWAGGLGGLVTEARIGRQRLRAPGLLDAEGARALVERLHGA